MQMHICPHIYIHKHIYIYIYTYTYTYIYMYVCMYMYIYVYICVYMYVCVCMYVGVHASALVHFSLTLSNKLLFWDFLKFRILEWQFGMRGICSGTSWDLECMSRFLCSKLFGVLVPQVIWKTCNNTLVWRKLFFTCNKL